MAERINPEMVILAREARGMTQSALAKELNVSQGHVSRWEGKMTEIPVEISEPLSRALQFPEAFFRQSDVRFGFGSSCFYHRKRQAMPVGELRIVQAWLNIFRMQITRMLRGAEVVRENEFFRLDVEDSSPPEIARRIRSAWRLPDGPVTDLVGSIESAGGIVMELPFQTDKLDAVTQWVPGVPPLFFINASTPGDRQRWTLAHELGHVIMHQIPNDEKEREADDFAAEFLLPEEKIRPYLRPLTIPKLAALKGYWHVSMAAIAKRARDLGCITERQYHYLFMQLGKYGYRAAEPVEVPRESATVLGDVVQVHLNDHGYTSAELASLVNSSEHEFLRHYLPNRVGSLRIVS